MYLLNIYGEYINMWWINTCYLLCGETYGTAYDTYRTVLRTWGVCKRQQHAYIDTTYVGGFPQAQGHKLRGSASDNSMRI